jgi:4-hydroxy-3-methylbut-2-enyl diphosphate reductase
MRDFEIPEFYLSSEIAQIKKSRNVQDPKKKDLSPTTLDLGSLVLKVARHFGFCFGVQNAIEIAYKALEENPGKRVFLLSEMIHNPHVNEDLISRGIKFLRTTEGKELISLKDLNPEDVVIIPAFGTTLELFDALNQRGINPYKYNTTCPFVEKVWTRAEQLGSKGYSIVVHGKLNHEETKATVSHAKEKAPTVVIRDLEMARLLARYVKAELPADKFSKDFEGRFSYGFDPIKDLQRLGVVNQTTMLATETWEIAEILKKASEDRFGKENLSFHFADTRDTLCYATSENQRSVSAMLEEPGDLAIIVGGYNSSNTSHLVELCEQKIPSYHIKDAGEIIDTDTIKYFDYKSHAVNQAFGWIPKSKDKITVLITAGASCPDALVDQVLRKLAKIFKVEQKLSEALGQVRV